jgi:exodeoxyribonuclease VII large subunit
MVAAMSEATLPNVVEFTVSELSNALKRALEDQFGFIRLRGEISGYRGPHSSGHAYFALKDATAKIDAVIWRGVLARMRVRPEEGMEVIACGKVTTFPGKSTYQIIIDSIEPAGVGALMVLLEERRRRLAGEGLFDAARKQRIPHLPTTIGVVTSPTGAVIRDILHRIAERFPRRVLVWPVRVQGPTSAAEIASAIAGFNALSGGATIGRPDVLIVARGGGSLEDLWGFNDELLVRTAARSTIPLIAAVGHETDWTLLDHVADVRAPTPTAAAEICVPVRAQLLTQLADVARRHRAAAWRNLERRRADWRAHIRALPGPDDLIAHPRQRFDVAAAHLETRFRSRLDRRKIRLHTLASRLAPYSPVARLARLSERLSGLGRRLQRSLAVAASQRRHHLTTFGGRLAGALRAHASLTRQQTSARRQRLGQAAARLRAVIDMNLDRRADRLDDLSKFLNSLGYRQVLARGFALVRDARGQPLRSVHAVATGSRLDIEFSDGRVGAVASDTQIRRPPVSRRPRHRPKDSNQGSLF